MLPYLPLACCFIILLHSPQCYCTPPFFSFLWLAAFSSPSVLLLPLHRVSYYLCMAPPSCPFAMLPTGTLSSAFCFLITETCTSPCPYICFLLLVPRVFSFLSPVWYHICALRLLIPVPASSIPVPCVFLYPCPVFLTVLSFLC